MDDLTGRRPGLLVITGVVLTAAVVGYAIWGPFPIQIDDWRWTRIADPVWENAIPALLAYGLIGLLAVLAWRRAERLGRGKLALVVGGLAALAFAAQVLAAKQLPGGYSESIVALGKPGANRYHAAARGVGDLGPVLDKYHRWMGDESHKLIVTHPGGPLTLFWCVNQVFARDEAAAGRFVRWCEDWFAGGVHVRDPQGPPALVGLFREMSEAELAGVWLAAFLLQAAAALAVVPVFAMARAVYGVRVGIVAAALAAVVPSLLLFSPGLDQLFPVLAATACWLAWTAGEKGSPWRAAFAGATVSAGLFFSLSFAVVAGWAGLLGIAALVRSGRLGEPRRVALLAAAAIGGFAVPAVTLYLAVGYNSPAVWSACVAANAKFNAQSGRVYWKWLLADPVEFVVFLGVPVASLVVAQGISSARGAWRRRDWRLADWPTLIVLGLLVALNLLGVNRGEVARLWMFLMPGCVVAAAACTERCAPYRRAVFVTMFALQVVQVTVLKSLLDALLGMYRGLG
ncbi:MAG TPA: hypothetical protein VNE39_21235 [Planctomycetota bacterium]|nr:hypothetical protein [Planctomycetota bacterium]